MVVCSSSPVTGALHGVTPVHAKNHRSCDDDRYQSSRSLALSARSWLVVAASRSRALREIGIAVVLVQQGAVCLGSSACAHVLGARMTGHRTCPSRETSTQPEARRHTT